MKALSGSLKGIKSLKTARRQVVMGDERKRAVDSVLTRNTGNWLIYVIRDPTPSDIHRFVGVMFHIIRVIES